MTTPKKQETATVTGSQQVESQERQRQVIVVRAVSKSTFYSQDYDNKEMRQNCSYAILGSVYGEDYNIYKGCCDKLAEQMAGLILEYGAAIKITAKLLEDTTKGSWHIQSYFYEIAGLESPEVST